ncbi:S46 family peptidase [Chitinophaga sancti]|uniref:Dipeptidyl-peptidase n=1 Tax=Chitinophaga sancti TaxID=1004 RepID=A0A1K1SU39_9BACT|nr:S46 family peptidase [Chitinophaga sancti]WQD60549.1 S46 family peptidase [Chitinophaga sancti]WQG87323.1 S46 family peptidase [Chitinophaga sancti]SFW87928.1 Peptidase S46 [Chitinophaga sancti]
MKKKVLLLLLLLAVKFAKADEGMWLPYLLGQQVYNDMVLKGLKLTKEQLYSINKASVKDAIIIFGGGCTGEIVSNQGLIFTNHHCGYDAIATASTVEHNYLKNGFYAQSKIQEIPANGLTVQFLVRVDDVTKKMEDALQGLSGQDRMKKQQATIGEIVTEATNGTGYEAKVLPLFKGNQFLLFVYERYKDIRLVGAPPESIGKFGGDTDNWEWPRHTGDFSVFRVYANKDGKPADYSADNVPLKPKHFLPVSIKGIKENDYAMIFGYPGGTNRYESSEGVKLKIEVENPSIVNLRAVRLKYMFDQMKKDPAIKLKLASSYASIANYWKFYDGETKQLLKYKVEEQKQLNESAFVKWAQGKPEFEHIFADYTQTYKEWTPYAKHRIYINEGIMGSPLAGFAASLQALEKAMVQPGTSSDVIAKSIQAADKARTAFLEEEDKTSDQKILAATCRMFYTEIPAAQHPIGFYDAVKAKFGSLDEDNTYRLWAAALMSSTMILNDARWKAFIEHPDAVTLQQDPAFAYSSAFIKNWSIKYLPLYNQFVTKINDLGRGYLKGLMQMEPNKKWYPDANFSMRLTYGQVKPYAPRDAVSYDYVCTMKGVLEKYKPGDYEFDLPANYVDLYNKKDFGQYKDARKNDIVTCFITTNDITGGNSGSPVLNGNGELIGLAFDGNYEALSHKIQFDPVYNRTICVDIRYVLWCIDKLGGAPNIISELKLVK